MPASSRAKAADALFRRTSGLSQCVPGRSTGAGDRFGTGEAAEIAASGADDAGGRGGDVFYVSKYALPAGPAHVRTHAPFDGGPQLDRTTVRTSQPPSPFARMDIQDTPAERESIGPRAVESVTDHARAGGWSSEMVLTRRASPLRMGSGRAMSGGSCLEVVYEGDPVVPNPPTEARNGK